jgi:hypothetical protein
MAAHKNHAFLARISRKINIKTTSTTEQFRPQAIKIKGSTKKAQELTIQLNKA